MKREFFVSVSACTMAILLLATLHFCRPATVPYSVLSQTRAAANYQTCKNIVACPAAAPCVPNTCVLNMGGGCTVGGGTTGSAGGGAMIGQCGFNVFGTCTAGNPCGNGGAPDGCTAGCMPKPCDATKGGPPGC